MRNRAEKLGIKVDGRWSESRILEEIMRAESEKIKEAAEPEAAEAVVNKFETVEWANKRAAAIWAGQSPSLSLLERVGRIKMALKSFGFTDFDNLVIPTNQDYKKYL